MIAFSLDPTRVRSTFLGAFSSGLLGGAALPWAASLAGAVPARAGLAGLVAASVLLARGSSGAPARVLVATALGALAALGEGWAPGGFCLALFGLGVGAAIAPEGLRGGFWRLLGRAAAPAAGAVLGAALLGAVARVGPIAALGPVGWGAALGGAIGLGVALGDAARTLVVASEEPPRELDAARDRLSAASRPLVEAARAGWTRAAETLAATDGGLLPHERAEALARLGDLARTTARSALAAEELSRALRTLEAAAPTTPAAGADHVRETPREAIARRLERARERAAHASAELVELSFALADRAAEDAPGPRTERRTPLHSTGEVTKARI